MVNDEPPATEPLGAAPPPPPPPFPPPPPRRRIWRRTDDRVIAGVAGGIADYVDVDPWIIRAAFVVLTVFGGAGIIFYVLGALTLPPGPPERAADPSTSPVARGRALPGPVLVALIVLGALLLLRDIGHGHLLVPLALIAVGAYFLWDRADGDRSDHRPPSAPTTGPQPPGNHGAPTSGSAFDGGMAAPGAGESGDAAPVGRPSDHVTTAAYGGMGDAARLAADAAERQRRAERAQERREARLLKLLAVAVSLVVVGTMCLLNTTDATSFTRQEVLAAPLIVLGIAMVVGAWYGATKGLAWLCLLLLPFVAVASVTNDLRWSNRTGVQVERPLVVGQMEQQYQFGAGKEILDLSSIQPDDRAYPIDVQLGAGELVVVIPKGVQTKILAEAGFGRTDILNRNDAGISPELRSTTPGTGASTGSLDIHAEVGFGRVLVTDDPNAPEARS